MEEEFESYEGDVLPFEEYDGEIIPLEEEEASEKPKAKNVLPTLNTGEGWLSGTTEQIMNLPSSIAGGVVNAGKNLAQTISTVAAASPIGLALEKGAEYLPEGGFKEGVETVAGTMNTPFYENPVPGLIEEYVPEYAPEGAIDEIGTTLGEVGAGLAVGNKAEGAVMAAKSLPYLLKTAARLGGAEAGMAAAVGSDSDTLITGENAILGDFNPLSVAVDDNGNYNENLLKQRWNILTDALLVAKPAEWIARGATGALGFIINNTAGKALKFGSQYSQEDEVARLILDKLVGIKDGMSPRELALKRAELIDIIDNNKEVVVKMAQEGIEDQKLILDTMSALEQGVDPNELELIARLRGIRKGAESKGSAQLEAAMDRPNQALDQTIAKAENIAGGDATIEEARQAVVKTGRDDVQVFRDEADTLSEAAQREARDATSLLENDPTFGSRLKDAAGETDLNFGREADELRFQIGDAATEELEKLQAGLTERVQTIPEGVKISNSKGFNETLNKAIKDKVLDADLAKAFKDTKGDFKKLYSLVPELNKNIDDVYRTSGSRNADKLIAIRNMINENIPDIPEAQEFKRFFKEEYTPFAKEGRTGELADLQKETLNRERAVQYEFPERRNQIIKGALDQDDFMVNQVNDLLKRGEKESLISDYYVADDMRKLSQRLASSTGLEDLSVTDILDGLGNKISKVEQINPDMAKRLNNLYNNIKKKQNNVSALRKEVDAANKAADIAEREIIGKELAPFFDKSMKNKEVANGYEVFKEFIGDKKNTQRLDGLIERIGRSGNENARRGLQSAYMKYFRENVFDPIREEGSGVQKLAKNTDLAFDRARKIFFDKPEFVEGLESLNRIAQQITSARESGKQSSFIDYGDLAKNARGALDLVITQMFGVLNRAGARVRSVGGRIVGAADPSQNLKDLTDTMLANPDEFLRIAKRVTSGDSLKIDDQKKRIIHSYLTQAGIYNDDYEEQPEGFEEPIDTSRPILENDDGSFSTEETITVEDEQGNWINLPTIVNGRRVSDEDAYNMMLEGINKPVGTFKTLKEAEKAAQNRTKEIGRVREKDRR